MVSEVLQVLPSFGSSTSSDGISASGSLKDIRQLNNLPFYIRAFKQAMDEAATGFSRRNSGEVTNFNFLGGTLLEKFINNNCTPETKDLIKSFDKSLLDSKTSQKAIENLFDCKFKLNKKTGKLALTASKNAIKANPLKLATGKIAADILGVTTRFGLLTSGLTEAPDLYSAYQNGDFCKQTVRSVSKIGVSTVAFGTIAHLAKEFAPQKYKTLIMFGGAIAGSIMSSKVTDKLLDKVMGKSIKTQNAEAQKYFTQMQQQRALMGLS